MMLNYANKTLISIFIVFCLTSPGLAKSEDVSKLPQPPNSRVVFIDKAVQINDIPVRGIQLNCSLRPEEIAVFYQNMLKQRGWELAYYLKQQNIMSFTAEGGYLYVAIVPGIGGHSVYVLLSPKDLSICRTLVDYFFKAEMVPDAEGKDIPDVPRYPGSRRRLNIFTQQEGQFLLYETDAHPKEVGDFYREMLEQYGWEPIPALNPSLLMRFTEAKDALKDVALVCYERGEEMIFIAAYQTPRQVSRSRTLITIMKNFWQELYPQEEGE